MKQNKHCGLVRILDFWHIYEKLNFNCYSSESEPEDQSNVGWTYYNKVMVRFFVLLLNK